MRKFSSNFLTTLEPPTKTLDTKNRRRTPNNRAEPLRFFQKAKVLDDTPCKTKKPPMGRCQPHQKASVNYMGGEAASPTNPERGRSGKLKTSYSDRPRDVSTGYYKYMSACTHMKLRQLYKIITQIALRFFFKTSIPRVTIITLQLHHAIHVLDSIAKYRKIKASNA